MRSYLHITKTILLASAGLLATLAWGQHSTPFVEAKVLKDSLEVGSQTTLTFSVATPSNYTWNWPLLADKIAENVEVVTQTGIDTARQQRSDLMMLTKQVVITSFDTGFHVVPPFEFQFRTEQDTAWNTIETEPFLIYVAGMEVDLSLPIRDIKGVMRVPITLAEMLLILLALVAVGATAYFVMRYIKKRKEQPMAIPVIARPKIPAHARALDALEQLRAKKLWQSGKNKDYHSELTEILRTYLEERYHIMALEMTTAEIMQAISSKPISLLLREKLHTIFERADLVKFAKSIPLAAEHEESFMYSVDFVRGTIPVAVEMISHENGGSNNQPVLNHTAETQ